jgi:UDP-N-acetylglucosamine transferase subunit ALG13
MRVSFFPTTTFCSAFDSRLDTDTHINTTITHIHLIGTGTIADACESEVALVIVANPNLMDNHQAVFAAEVAEEYDNIILGHLG